MNLSGVESLWSENGRIGQSVMYTLYSYIVIYYLNLLRNWLWRWGWLPHFKPKHVCPKCPSRSFMPGWRKHCILEPYWEISSQTVDSAIISPMIQQSLWWEWLMGSLPRRLLSASGLPSPIFPGSEAPASSLVPGTTPVSLCWVLFLIWCSTSLLFTR